MDTIQYIHLSTSAQKRMEREDPDEKCLWFAKPHGQGHQLHSIEKSQEDLFEAQGGMGEEGWLRVVFTQD